MVTVNNFVYVSDCVVRYFYRIDSILEDSLPGTVLVGTPEGSVSEGLFPLSLNCVIALGFFFFFLFGQWVDFL